MSKGHDHKQKKKMTTKELKAMNHAKLMAGKGSGAASASTENKDNVIQLNTGQQFKKAA